MNGIVAYLVCSIVRENRQLQHLDLQNTNLPGWAIKSLAGRLRKSRSLLSLHLSDNPGIRSATLRDYIFDVLRCKDIE